MLLFDKTYILEDSRGIKTIVLKLFNKFYLAEGASWVLSTSEAYSEPSKTSKMDLFAKIVDGV